MVAIALKRLLPKPRQEGEDASPGCPRCGGRLIDIRGQLHCTRCRTLCESACEGGRYSEADR
jgi:hypothetical protein